MRQPSQHHYEFGSFRLETTERRLLRDGNPVPLTAKVFDILLVLVQNQGHLLEKNDLMQAVWPDSFVEESNLTRSISTLRKALGECDGEYIETVPKRGYRFVAAVERFGNESITMVVQERIHASVIVEEEEEEIQIDGEMEKQREAEMGAKDSPRLSISPSLHPPVSPSRFLRQRLSRQVVIMGVMLIGLAVGMTFWWKSGRAKPNDTVAAVRSIAVLPFKPLNGDNGDECLSLGLADTLITRLSGLRSLIVRPTSAVRKYSSPEQDPLAAGREQRVDAVLDANLQRDGDRIRVTVRLLSVRDGKALWIYQCDEVQCNLFAMQDVISEEVAVTLMPRLTGEERRRLRKHDTENREAYQAYVKGLWFWNKRTTEGAKKGIEYFEQAIEKDPNYALACVGKANCYTTLALSASVPPKECFPKAKVWALRAIGIDDGLAEAHASLAQILHFYDWNWAEAEKEFKRAIELNQGYAYAHQWYGTYLLTLGRFDEGKAEVKRSLEFDPVSLVNNDQYAAAFYYARDYDQALALARKTLELDPNWDVAYWRLGMIYELKGMHDQAIAEYLQGESPERMKEYKNAYAVSGIRGYWRKRTALAIEASQREYRSKYGHSLTYARLGEKEQVIRWLQQAYDDREQGMVKLKIEPLFDGMRSDPRFIDLMRRVGLAP